MPWNAWRADHLGTRVILDGENLNGMILTGIDFSRASLRGASMHATNLMNADLRGADLTGANLAEADLIMAKLDGAILTGANLREADLLGANLAHAIYGAADLEGALHVPHSPGEICPTDRDGLLLATGHRTLICLAGRSPSYDLALLAPRVFGVAASEISAGPERDESPRAVALVTRLVRKPSS